MKLSKRIKQLRNEKGIYQKELAEYLGVSRPTITQYESGTRKPDPDTLKKIATFFNVSLDYLLGRTNERQPADKIILNDKNKDIEIKELFNRFNVMLDGETLDDEAKDSVIELLRFLRDREKRK